MRVLRVHLFFRKSVIAAFTVAAVVFLCTLYAFRAATPVFDPVKQVTTPRQDTILPADTLSAHHTTLRFEHNLFFVDDTLYSGIIRETYPDGKTKYLLPVYKGMRHGVYTSYYANGHICELRAYRHNLANGQHTGYWENGRRKFLYTYTDDRRNGYMYQWYDNGRRYMITHYINDREDGLQQAWRDNGKLFINYVAKDGHTYGLAETQLCYRVINQQIRKL